MQGCEGRGVFFPLAAFSFETFQAAVAITASSEETPCNELSLCHHEVTKLTCGTLFIK